MRRRRHIVRKDIIGKKAVKWCILISLIAGLLGVSYAAYTNVLDGVFHIGTGSMDFVFDGSNHANVAAWIQSGYEDDPADLGGDVDYNNDYKKLYITNLGPIGIEDLTSGNAVITINYAIKPNDEGDEEQENDC